MKSALLNAQRYLLSAQAEGGWPYVLGEQNQPEATCYSLLALFSSSRNESLPGTQAAVVQGVTWLRNHVTLNGAVTLEGDEEPHWSTSLAVLTFTRIRQALDVRDRSIEFLLDWHSTPLDPDPSTTMDMSRIGWPWIRDTFGWVEPTSYAVLALRAAGYETHPRVQEACGLLIDRACKSGGWNYGNPVVFNRDLSAFVPTTVWALLALQDVATAATVITKGWNFLHQEITQCYSTLSLALGILCGCAYGEPVKSFVAPLLARQDLNGSWRQMTHLTALSVLALRCAEEGYNVFKV